MSNSLLLIYSETSFRTFLLFWFWFCEIIKLGFEEEWKAQELGELQQKKRKLFLAMLCLVAVFVGSRFLVVLSKIGLQNLRK